MQIRKLSIALAVGVSLCAGVAASAAVHLFTVVGGASGMTLDLNPYGSLVRGCAPKMMDACLKNKRLDPDTGTVKYAYARPRIKSNDSYSEPNVSGPWGVGQVQFTGDRKDTEIEYCKMENGDIWYAIVIRADSVLGMRYVVNKNFIWGFTQCDKSADSFIFATSAKTDAQDDPDFQAVLADMNTNLSPIITGGKTTGYNASSTGIAIEGGLTEAYLDSGIDAIDKYNAMYPPIAPGPSQPQLNPANFSNIQDNLLSVAVMAIIYNKYIQENWNGSLPVNFTTEQIRMIEGGFVDNWDFFFSSCAEPNPDHKRIYNFFREPLSGTAITFLGQTMRGVDTAANGAVATQYYDEKPASATYQTWVNCPGTLAKSGVPNLTCLSDPSSSDAALGYNPGSGEVNKAVGLYYGGIGYTFLQRFTPSSSYTSWIAGNPHMANIRLATVNGAQPIYWDTVDIDSNPIDPINQNSLPGINGQRDVTYSRPDGKSMFQDVIDGKYPLWTYNHCFARKDLAQGSNLPDFVEKFTNSLYVENVRAVGLIPLPDMSSYASYRSMPDVNSKNAGRGKGIGRCGFLSPRTGEIVRDGMMMMPLDQNAKLSDGSVDPKHLPAEGYPEMRP